MMTRRALSSLLLCAILSPCSSFSARAAGVRLRSHASVLLPGTASAAATGVVVQRAGIPYAQQPELPPSGTKLDDFLVLVGRCYAGAGLAHAIDFATANALPAAAGLEPFADLPAAGQAFGVVWVLLGLVQPLAATRETQQAGLIAYGVYEIILTLAASTATADPEGNLARLGAAAGVQAIVAYCYFELKRQSIEAAASASSSSDGGGSRKSGAAARSTAPRMMARGQPGRDKGGKGKGSGKEVQVGGLQQKLEEVFGKDLFQSLVVLTGVLCYPLMAYGVLTKMAERGGP